MIATTRWSHRSRRHTAAAVAATIALLSVVFVAADSTTTGAATPPAELVSVIAPPLSGASHNPSINDDGAFIGFDFSDFQTEGQFLKVRNRPAGQTEDVADPAPLPVNFQNQSRLVLSRDGCQVAYVSRLTMSDAFGTYFGDGVFAANRCTGSPAVQIYSQPRADITPPLNRSTGPLAISAHGRYVAFSNDSLGNGVVIRVDRDPNGNGVLDDTAPALASQGTAATGPSLGDENFTGRVALSARLIGTRVIEVYLWDPTKAAGDPLAMTLVSAADTSATTAGTALSSMPSMTPDGRYVAFVSQATNLAGTSPNGTIQVFVRDVLTNRTVMVSRNSAGVGGNGLSVTPSINADGTQIAFGSTSTDLLAPGVGGVYDPNNTGVRLDLLVVRSTGGFFDAVAFDRVSLMPNGDTINPNLASMAMEQPVISSNGRWVAFASRFNAELQTGGSSAAGGADTNENVYVIGRPTSVAVTPLDFGSLQVATTSGVLSATVSNTGISSFQPASIAANGDFSVVGGGSCVVNAWLAPGQSCTVAVQFKPSTTGPRSGTLTLAETGFAAITASGTLSGSGSATPVPTTTTSTNTTTTTTIPNATNATTPTTTLPKATPKIASLTITPNPGSFGTSIVGVASAPIEFTVTSTGTRSAPISNVSIDANDTDFTIVTNDCNGANLPPGASCGIVVAFTPTATGPRAGLLTAGSAIASANATLTGSGVTEPTLRLLPSVVELGGITIAVGTGFPPNVPIQVHWVGDTTTFTGTADGSGNVTISVFVRPQEIPGPRTFAAVDQPPQFTGVTTPGLVVDPSMHPPTSQNPALPNFPSLVVRG